LFSHCSPFEGSGSEVGNKNDTTELTQKYVNFKSFEVLHKIMKLFDSITGRKYEYGYVPYTEQVYVLVTLRP
jgi:hypothetical protein